MPLIECVPNFSEGRDAAVISAIAAAVESARGRVLDTSLDASHNRAVITFVAEEHDVVAAAFAGIREARNRIDLATHTGVHPRIGAADVVPFVPLDGSTIEDCVRCARELADRVGSELQIPVYLYEFAALRDAYRNLADVRRGGLTALQASIGSTRPPDAGPASLHPTAGAVAIGARHFLGAFNVFVGGAEHVAIAKAIAAELRAANGGLAGVKALGLVVSGQAQVSMNLTDLGAVALHDAFDAVARAAQARGIDATHSEIIGLAPQAAIERTFADRIRLRDARETVSLERRIASTARADDLTRTADAVASLALPEASGTASALAAILASATVRLAAGVHVARAKPENAAALAGVVESAVLLERQLHVAARDDAAAWQNVVAARRVIAPSPGAKIERTRGIDAALMAASDVPLRIAGLALDVLALSVDAAVHGDHVTAPDAWTGATISHAAVNAALGLMRGNLGMLSDMSPSADHRDAARALSVRADSLLREARTSVGGIAG